MTDVQQRVKSFLDDDRGGERDTLTTLLILALIIIPLILVVIAFGNEIKDFAKKAWEDVIGQPVGN